VLQAGQVVDRYVVERLLGVGGMGMVFLVRHAQLGSAHALKVLHGASPGVRERLVQEGRLQARWRHPNLLPGTDVLEVDDSPGLVMDFVDGPTLDAWRGDRAVPVAEAIALVTGICAGVAVMHRDGFIHRDLKPANVMLQDVDGVLVPRVADLGLAKALGGSGVTKTGSAVGTPAYMPPEQFRDAAHVDLRADTWSLGCILYELVCGAPPFSGPDLPSIFDAVSRARFVPATERVPDLPPVVASAISAALSLDPAARPADAGSFLAMLRSVPSQAPSAPPRVPSAAPAVPTAPQPLPPGEGGAERRVRAGSGRAGATFHADSTLLPVEAPPARALAPRRASAGAALALVAALGIAAGLAGAWWLSQPAGLLTRAERATLPGDATVELVERALAAVLAADFDAAQRSLDAARTKAPGSAMVAMLLAVVHLCEWDIVGIEELDAAARMADAAGPPPGQALAWAREMMDSGKPNSDAGAALDGGRASVATQVLLANVAPYGIESGRRDLEPWCRLRPGAATGTPYEAIQEARCATTYGSLDAAGPVLRTALGRFPDVAWIGVELGEWHVTRGEAKEGFELLTRALQLDPGARYARAPLAAAATVLGDEPARLAQAEAMLGEQTPARWRIAFARLHGVVLARFGRMREALGLWDTCEREAAAADLPPSRCFCTDIAMSTAVRAERFDLARDYQRKLQALLLDPKLAPLERETYAARNLVAEGRLALHEGKVDAARAALERLESMSTIALVDRESFLVPLRVRVPLAEGNCEAARAALDGFAGTEGNPGCERASLAADLARVCAPSELDAALLDAERACTKPEPWALAATLARAQAVAEQAERARARGDEAAAEAAVARLREVFPAGDTELPVLRRATALEGLPRQEK
jgi:serine/threonine-protein kinase